MKPSTLFTAFCLAISTSGFGTAQTQQPAGATPSLGDLARQLKIERSKASQKPEKVFTNDNLPARPPGEGPTAATGMSATAGEHGESKAEAAPSSETSGEAHNEKYYRAKLSELQSNLDLHQRELSVLQQKLNQNEMQYYPDPNKTLTQEFNRGDINKLTQEIDQKKAQVEADQKAIDDLREQLRHEGGDPGWLR